MAKILVKATKLGFLGGERRYPEAPAFEIDKEQFSENWMELVEKPKKKSKPKTTKKKTKVEKDDGTSDIQQSDSVDTKLD